MSLSKHISPGPSRGIPLHEPMDDFVAEDTKLPALTTSLSMLGFTSRNNQSQLLTPVHPCEGRCSSSHLLCQVLSEPPDLDPELQPQRAQLN